MNRILLALLAWMTLSPLEAAETYTDHPIDAVMGYMTSTGCPANYTTPCFKAFGANNPLSVATLVAAPVAITQSDSATFTPGTYGIKITVTAPGSIKFGFPNGVTWTDSFPVAGVYQYPWGANQIFVTGSTATFSAWTF